jgi:hypothetical protein
VKGVPFPEGAELVTKGNLDSTAVSYIGNMKDVAEGYKAYMEREGWTFDAATSELDPDKAEGKMLGYLATANYCKPGDDRFVSISVAYPRGERSGEAVVISIMDATDPTACPS